jgi:hypothetical protein
VHGDGDDSTCCKYRSSFGDRIVVDISRRRSADLHSRGSHSTSRMCTTRLWSLERNTLLVSENETHHSPRKRVDSEDDLGSELVMGRRQVAMALSKS